MKFADVLCGYVPYAGGQVAGIWSKADFCLDTNVLLNVYRYTDENRTAFLKLISAIKGRLFAPRRVALEFCRNRIKVIRGHYKPHRELKSGLDQIVESISKTYAKRPDLADLFAVIEAAKQAVDANFGEAEKNTIASLTTTPSCRT
jgi:predicted nucleic acid-binding protein